MPKGVPTAGYRNTKRVSPQIERAVEIACKRISKDALTFLEDVLNDKEADARVRMMAAKEILDRAWGRPKQNVEQNVSFDAGDNLLRALREARIRAQQEPITAEFVNVPAIELQDSEQETLQ